MLRKLSVFFIFTMTFGILGLSQARHKSSKEEAVAMVKQAGAFYQEHGLKKALAAFNNPKGPFIKNELYLFVYDKNGVNLAHGQNPKMVGKNLLEMRDSDGLYIIKKVIEIGDSKTGNGWQSYKWPNPMSKQVEQKLSYTEKFGDLYISCGIYP